MACGGIAKRLRRRVAQHLIKRDSSVATGTSAACLNPDFITEVVWWCEPDFADQAVLEAAELVAFEHFDPALRSRGTITDRARRLAKGEEFQARMYGLFTGASPGKIVLPSVLDMLRRLEALERSMSKLQGLLRRQGIFPT
jgi:hypothetical protein